MRTGVKLLLEPGTRVPNWVRNQTLNVEVGRGRLNGRTIRFLKIRKGEASFFPGGSVVVKMPGSDEFWGAFQPMKVLEIRDLRNNLIERNYYLCTECATLTGEKEGYTLIEKSSLVTELGLKFKCTHCGNQWEFKRLA